MKKLLVFLVGLGVILLSLSSANAATFTFTDDADWDTGVYASTNSGPPGADDQIQIDPNTLTQFNYIWVALSGRNTVARIDTDTGTVLGEYYSAPQGQPGNPSRTTVDLNGDVWVGNRNQSSGGQGSIAKISASATGPDTSTGVWNAATGAAGTFDARPWTNAGGADTNGGTSTAQDTAIMQYIRTSGTNARSVAVDANNNVWVGGLGNRQHQLYDENGAPVAGPHTSFNIGRGGYGAVIDGNGVLWSAGFSGGLVRFDPATGATRVVGTDRTSYGLAVDTDGNIWNSNWTANTIRKYDSDGNVLGTYSTAGSSSFLRGVAITLDNNVWIAGSGSSSVTRMASDGTILATIAVGSTPTGVAVDSNGKVWVTNYGSNNVMRIDPATNLVDLTVNLGARANPYNYSDMTGGVFQMS